MDRGHREALGQGRLVLRVQGRPSPPPLRFETAGRARMLLRQGERVLLLGRADGEGCCRDLALHRLDGYRSPLPPIRSALARDPGNWPHRYASWLEESTGTPLHDGRWQLGERRAFPPYVWGNEEFVRDWPGGSLALYCGGGWNGVLPLRRLSAPDAPRVKAYRKQAADGTLAPVLLWWVAFLDGWLLLDGHDRAVAALAEGRTPPCVVLTRVADDEVWRREFTAITEGTPHTRHMTPAYGDTLAGLPYEPAGTRTWPLPGGAPAWEDLAGQAVFQYPRD
ncbi:hypothetical protein [Streptomyces sp. NPDC054829]